MIKIFGGFEFIHVRNILEVVLKLFAAGKQLSVNSCLLDFVDLVLCIDVENNRSLQNGCARL